MDTALAVPMADLLLMDEGRLPSSFCRFDPAEHEKLR